MKKPASNWKKRQETKRLIEFYFDLSDLHLTGRICFWLVEFYFDLSTFILTCRIWIWLVEFAFDSSNLVLTCWILFWLVGFEFDLSGSHLTCRSWIWLVEFASVTWPTYMELANPQSSEEHEKLFLGCYPFWLLQICNHLHFLTLNINLQAQDTIFRLIFT